MVSATSGDDIQNAWYSPSVASIWSRQACVTSVEDSSLPAILAASCAASSWMISLTGFPPRICRPPRPGGRRGQRFVRGQARRRGVGPRDVDVFERFARRLDVGDVDRLNLADMLDDGAELAGEAVQLIIGQGESASRAKWATSSLEICDTGVKPS